MWISCKILVLLWMVNFAPPFFAIFLNERYQTPVDLGFRMKDGRTLFGPHKTIRGVLAGVATGGLVGWLMGFPAGIGFGCGALSMAGDILTSFIKRRLGKPSGSVVIGMDQLLEGALPFLVLAPYVKLGAGRLIVILILFCIGAYVGSFLFSLIFVNHAMRSYRRKIGLRHRLREWRACDMAYTPFHPFFNFERAIFYHFLLRTVFRVFGLYGKGRQNALEIRLNQITFGFEDLPAAFDEYTILFLTDLHLDGLTGLNERVKALVSPLKVDLCLFGGDYRTELSGPYSKVLIRMRRLLGAIHTRDGIYAVLGNHDCTEMIQPLEKKGLTFLINDAVELKRGADRIWLVGIDDPHYYRAHDFQQSFAAIPSRAFSVLLAHTPEVYQQAASYGAKLYLCGHTHAGQIQIPKIGPVFTHSRAPRRYSQGHWRFDQMQGYTSSGVGVSGIPVRFGTIGEVVLIRLKHKRQTVL